jgi:hypothetical protein
LASDGARRLVEPVLAWSPSVARCQWFSTLIASLPRSSQVQNLLWLSGIVLASNGVVIALLARIAGAIRPVTPDARAGAALTLPAPP